MLLPRLPYKCKYDGYNATFHGKSKCHFKVTILELLGISNLNERKVKLKAIQKHLLRYNYSPRFKDFSILTEQKN